MPNVHRVAAVRWMFGSALRQETRLPAVPDKTHKPRMAETLLLPAASVAITLLLYRRLLRRFGVKFTGPDRAPEGGGRDGGDQ